ncbi:MAG: N-acetyltransferase, partial [Chloroflexi bacterium]|nr:N-acetyltransferase [Chloroflexota bacterium]
MATHVGDLDWWMWQHEELDPTSEIRLWFEGDALVGWAWLTPPASLDFHLHPDRGDALLKQMLGWLTERSKEGAANERSFWALDHDRSSVALLRRNGYRRTEQHFVHALRRLDGEVAAPVLSDGFVVRPIRGDEELSARVAVHRAAFAPSRVTEQSYRNVMRASTYRPELDMVVVAPDGTFAAFCLCWFDQENGVGELEPV